MFREFLCGSSHVRCDPTSVPALSHPGELGGDFLQCQRAGRGKETPQKCDCGLWAEADENKAAELSQELDLLSAGLWWLSQLTSE